MNIYLMKKPKRVNSVSVTLFVMAAVTAYLGWALIPIYWPVFQLTGIMRGVCNAAYREKNNDLLIEQVVKEGRRTGLRLSKENFSFERIPYSEEELLSAPEGLRFLLGERGKFCVLSFHYEDNYVLPLIERNQRFVFDRTIKTELEQVSWSKEDNCTCVSVPTGQ